MVAKFCLPVGEMDDYSTETETGPEMDQSSGREYGDALVSVRYRYDEATRTRRKTVELIVEKKELASPGQKIDDEALVPVQIAYAETALIKMAKALGGRWDPEVRLWFIQRGKIKLTELEKHIILDAKMKIKNHESI